VYYKDFEKEQNEIEEYITHANIVLTIHVPVGASVTESHLTCQSDQSISVSVRTGLEDSAILRIHVDIEGTTVRDFLWYDDWFKKKQKINFHTHRNLLWKEYRLGDLRPPDALNGIFFTTVVYIQSLPLPNDKTFFTFLLDVPEAIPHNICLESPPSVILVSEDDVKNEEGLISLTWEQSPEEDTLLRSYQFSPRCSKFCFDCCNEEAPLRVMLKNRRRIPIKVPGCEEDVIRFLWMYVADYRLNTSANIDKIAIFLGLD
jgi:hypothetical protein